MFNIDNITRKNIRLLEPYSSARDEYNAKASIWLDANENPEKSALNRYPDPQQKEVKKSIAKLKEVDSDQIFIGNGSDEAIDLLFRAFCEPKTDKAFIFPPTYGMYEVSAAINNIEVVKLPLKKDFQIPPIQEIKAELKSTGLLFICSPNNPTGNSIDIQKIRELSINFYGLVIVDEAYIDYSSKQSAISLLNEIPNLVVLQTFSKAWGMAGLRIGMAFASKEIIAVLNKIKPPYNINTRSQQEVINALQEPLSVENQVEEIKRERNRLTTELSLLPSIINVYPSEANFLLVKFKAAQNVFDYLIGNGIVVRNRSHQVENCLRITIGTSEENKQLMQTLRKMKI